MENVQENLVVSNVKEETIHEVPLAVVDRIELKIDNDNDSSLIRNKSSDEVRVVEDLETENASENDVDCDTIQWNHIDEVIERVDFDVRMSFDYNYYSCNSRSLNNIPEEAPDDLPGCSNQCMDLSNKKTKSSKDASDTLMDCRMSEENKEALPKPSCSMDQEDGDQSRGATEETVMKSTDEYDAEQSRDGDIAEQPAASGYESDLDDITDLKVSRKRKHNSLPSPAPPALIKKYLVQSPSAPATPGEPEPEPSIFRGPPEVRDWLDKFVSWSETEKSQAIDSLISCCSAGQVRRVMKTIEPLLQRDFISLLPKELALNVLSYLRPSDLSRAARTCRYWRFLADDNLLWKEQCRRAGIDSVRAGPRAPPASSPWKAAFVRRMRIEHNWVHRGTAEPLVMRGHDDHVITCLQFHGNHILSGSDDTTLKIWSATTGKCLRTLVGHSGGVWSSQMGGELVVSGSTDRSVRVWDAASGRCLHVFTGHTSTVRCLHLHGSRVVSGSRDATLRLWCVRAARCLRVLVGHLGAVRCVQYDGRVVVSGAYDYFVKVWDPESGLCVHTLAGHTNRVYSLQFDGRLVVSGSLDTSIRVWDVRTGLQKHALLGHQSLTSGMELRGRTLVSGNADSTVKIWDVTTGQCLHTLTGPDKHISAVTCVQTTNRFVITSSDDGTVKLWDLHTGEFIRNLVVLNSMGSGGVVWRIRASATKLVCAVGSRNGIEDTKLLILDFDVPELSASTKPRVPLVAIDSSV